MAAGEAPGVSPMDRREAACYSRFVHTLPRLLRRLKRLAFRTRAQPWESQGRMKVVSDLLKSAGLDGGAVLDVGGAAVGDVLQRYGIGDVTTLDLDARADIVASAAAIPRPDRSFDAVTCIDTLEHIPRELRLQVVDELVRVARTAVVIVAPRDTAENRAAEALVLRYTGEPFLREHLANGLVDFAAIRAHLEQLAGAGRIRRFEYREIDDLLLWACLMCEDFASTSEVYEQLQWLDHAFHARRGVLLVWCGQPEAS